MKIINKDQETKISMDDNFNPSDDYFNFDEIEFIPCSLCDGHPACEDFGCAFDLGIGKLVKNTI